jgi:serine/threonine protein kinase
MRASLLNPRSGSQKRARHIVCSFTHMSQTLGFEESIREVSGTPLSDSLVPGVMVSPHLRLIRPLAHGGMGCLWVADHLELGTLVVVKFLHRSQSPAAAAARLRREVRATARVRSAHVVQVLYQDSFDGLPYIVMEHLDGETLETFLSRRGRLPLEETVQIVAQIGRVLVRAHEAGVIHQDIKPDNLFMLDTEADPFVKIIDFGIARCDGGEVCPVPHGEFVGTPQYMCPEQLGGLDAGRQADLWALAVVAYICLTGALPFEGHGVVAVTCAIAREDFALPSALVSNLDGRLDGWFRRAFAPRLSERFASADAMLLSLERAASGQEPQLTASRAAADVGATTVTARSRLLARSRMVDLSVAISVLALTAMGGCAVIYQPLFASHSEPLGEVSSKL